MRYLLIVLLSLVALSMVITLVPSFGGGFGTMSGGREDVVAKVGDENVTSLYVRKILEQQFRAGQLNPSIAEIAIPSVVNQVVGELSTAYQARQMGFQVSDAELIKGIEAMIPQLFQNGEFAGKPAYQAMLAQMNLTIPEFETKVRQQLLLDKLQRVAFDGIVVSPKEAEAEFQKRSEKRRLQVVKMDAEEMKASIKPTTAELEAYAKQNQARFQVPAKRDLGLIIADADKLGEGLPITDDQLKKEYGASIDRYKTPERVHARHILVKVEQNADAAAKAKAKAKAEDLLKQIKGGGNFAELAKKNSDDPGSGAKGGDLDWFGRGQMVKPFEDAAFSTKVNEVTNLVESQFGFHIIQPLGHEMARTKPFEEVRDALLSETRKRQLFERMPNLMEQARGEISKAPKQAQAIAQKLGLYWATVSGAGSGTEYPLIGKSVDIDLATSTLAQDGTTQVIQTKDNRLVMAVATAIIPARPAGLADQEKEIRQAYIEDQARKLLETRSKEFDAKLKANNNDLEKTAKELGKKVIDTGDFKRTDQIKDVGTAAYFGEQAFTMPIGHTVSNYRVASQVFFWKIVGQTPGPMTDFESQRATVVSAIKDRKLRERRELFEVGLIEELKRTGKVKIFDDVVKRLAMSYRRAA